MTEAQLSTAVIENPEMLKYQRRQQQQQLDQKNAAAREMGPAASVAGVVNGESLEDIRKVRAWPSGAENMGTGSWTGHRPEWWGSGCVGSTGKPAWTHVAQYPQLHEVVMGPKVPLSKAFLPQVL